MKEPNRVNPVTFVVRCKLERVCYVDVDPVRQTIRAVIFRDLIEAETASDEASAAILRDELLGMNRAD